LKAGAYQPSSETGSKNKDFPISKNKEKRKNNAVSDIFLW
jgi:hypothetical protein